MSPPLTSHTNLASKGFRSPSIPTASTYQLFFTCGTLTPATDFLCSIPPFCEFNRASRARSQNLSANSNYNSRWVPRVPQSGIHVFSASQSGQLLHIMWDTGFSNLPVTQHPARSPIERVIKLLEEMQAVIQVGYATFRRTGNSGPVKDADDLDNVLAAVHVRLFPPVQYSTNLFSNQSAYDLDQITCLQVLFKGCTNIAKLQEHLIFCAPPSCRLGSFNRSQLDLIWKLLGGDENDTQLAPSISESLRILRYNDAPDAPVQMQVG